LILVGLVVSCRVDLQAVGLLLLIFSSGAPATDDSAGV
jgi:hypothetical protein